MTVRVTFAPATLQAAFNDDPEFRLCARYWTGIVRFGVGDVTYTVAMSDGVVSEVQEGPVDEAVFAGPLTDVGSREVNIGAPAADWAMLVQDPPPPFYLDYYSASHHHSFSLSGDPDSLWAYYPAIRRTTELFRQIATVEEV